MYASGKHSTCSTPADFDWFDYAPIAEGKE